MDFPGSRNHLWPMLLSMTRDRTTWLCLPLALVLILMVPVRGGAQATPYVPNLDPVYQDLDGLIAAGWVRTAIAGLRPYSRLTVARMVVEARANVTRDGGFQSQYLREALDRLERAFAPEIHALCVGEGASCAPLTDYAMLRSATADATWADSPGRRISTSYGDVANEYIDAELNPLVQKNQGRVLADGGTLGGEALVDFGLGTLLSVQIRPRVWATASPGDGSNLGITLLEGYARGLLGNLAVEVGRNHVSRGYGREAGPTLSHNARGLDLVRISLDRPARLPWVLRVLGPVGASALLADMGGNSDTPHSKLVVFQGSLKPHPNLELGATLLNHQGGGSGPSATFVERLQDVFLIYPQGKEISDKVIEAAARLTFPAAGLQLYMEVLTTDDHDLLSSPDQALVTEAVWVVGASVSGLGTEGRTQLWVEARRAGVRPHTHHQFTSGLTLDGRIIGDAMGPLGKGLAAGVDWRGSRHTVGLLGAVERYNGADRYEDISGDGRFAWVRTLDRPDEIRIRVMGDWVVDAEPRGFGTSVRVGYEHVTHSAFTTRGRSNFLAQVKLGYHW
ncbi:MAG TPA: hypothetical protein DIU18_03220 [Gemmatimonadetes bacterium]|nr:hypothetical protein [Gemmatimonadota bacterium]